MLAEELRSKLERENIKGLSKAYKGMSKEKAVGLLKSAIAGFAGSYDMQLSGCTLIVERKIREECGFLVVSLY